MADYIIGIDGGATRSVGVAMGLDGTILSEASGQGLNACATSVTSFQHHLQDLWNVLTARRSGTCLSAVIGTASLFEEASPSEKEALLDTLTCLPRKTRLIGDAMTALYGATSGNPGVLVISGTGSIAMALGADGKHRTMGGFGALLGGDPGSAFWMSCQAILHAETLLPSSPLRRAIVEHFDVATLHDLVGLSVDQIASLSGHLSICMSEDTHWQHIEEDAGRALARFSWPLLEDHPQLPVYVSGSVLEKNQRVRGAFSQALAINAGHDVPLITPCASAALGAAFLALHTLPLDS